MISRTKKRSSAVVSWAIALGLASASGCRTTREEHLRFHSNVPSVQATTPTAGPDRDTQHETPVAQSTELPPTLVKPEPDRLIQRVAHAVDALPQSPSAMLADGTDLLVDASAPLELDEVLLSVIETYPMLRYSEWERGIADGKHLSAWGEFDLQAKAYSIAAPLGFYENYRSLITVTQPVYSHGGYVYGGYKIGDGDFQPWFGERETNEGGELSLGVGIPLLKDRAIDKRRAAILQTSLARQAVEPAIDGQLLDFARDASQYYWYWVASGKIYSVQERMLELAKSRAAQVETRVKSGDLPAIEELNNQRLIASRETKLIEATRKFQSSAIKLSLYLRSSDGAPVLADVSRLPEKFPPLEPVSSDQLEADIATALASRPELQELDLQMRQAQVELNQANNMRLPKLDAQLGAAQDVGGLASSKGDKQPLELEAGLFAEVPWQRREAQGKITSASAKLNQYAAKRQFTINKITTLVQDAHSALNAASEGAIRAQKTVELAQATLTLGRDAFEAGDIDLVVLNIYEQAVADAEIQFVAAQADFFVARAEYHAALALDPRSW